MVAEWHAFEPESATANYLYARYADATDAAVDRLAYLRRASTLDPHHAAARDTFIGWVTTGVENSQHELP